MDELFATIHTSRPRRDWSFVWIPVVRTGRFTPRCILRRDHTVLGRHLSRLVCKSSGLRSTSTSTDLTYGTLDLPFNPNTAHRHPTHLLVIRDYDDFVDELDIAATLPLRVDVTRYRRSRLAA